MAELLDHLIIFGISLGIIIVFSGLVFLAHIGLTRLFADKPDRQHYRQLILIATGLFALTLAFILIPVSDTTQGQLLGFLGIFLGAAIAFSSANPIANIISGISLRASRELAIGDYIESADYRGRIVQMDLLGVVIAAGEQGTANIPNVYLAANPVSRNSAMDARVQTGVSVGYDWPRGQIEEILLQAAKDANVDEAVVEIGSLEDFTVVYRVCGRVADIDQLTKCQLALRAAVLDGLQNAGITIGVYAPAAVPQSSGMDVKARQAELDNVAANKEQKANELEKLKNEYTGMSQRLIEVEHELREAGPGEKRKPLNLEKKKLEAKLLRTEKEIAKAEAMLEAA
ncbi:MAG: mechanosensitive ion channel [Gammaproteobacteria bacterium]|nr:mechanosensitive ion channel [Gammaproteobacteria bacterium]HJP05529.1 mechanosensitive ion channel [Gammaproteobacteria bacterium]